MLDLEGGVARHTTLTTKRGSWMKSLPKLGSKLAGYVVLSDEDRAQRGLPQLQPDHTSMFARLTSR